MTNFPQGAQSQNSTFSAYMSTDISAAFMDLNWHSGAFLADTLTDTSTAFTRCMLTGALFFVSNYFNRHCNCCHCLHTNWHWNYLQCTHFNYASTSPKITDISTVFIQRTCTWTEISTAFLISTLTDISTAFTHYGTCQLTLELISILQMTVQPFLLRF